MQPTTSPVGFVGPLPGAAQPPAQITGLAPGIAAENQFARHLAGNGFEVVVPTLIDRSSQWSGHPDIGKTDEPHREWIYRQGFHLGRQIIAHEGTKELAAVGWFGHRN